MDWIYIVALAVAGLTQCSQGQQLIATFHMEGVTGGATLSWADNDLSVELNIEQNLGATTVEIHPIWVNYDGMNKCSSELLGETLQGLSKETSISANSPRTITYSDAPSFNHFEGHSIVLKSTGVNKVICGTIQQNEDHVTALVKFQGTFFGHVFLRQSLVSERSTRIVTDLTSLSGAKMADWRIINSFQACDQIMDALINIYDPTSSASNSCSTTNHRGCAIGDLSNKLGQAYFSEISGSPDRRAYTDFNLPLHGENNVTNLLMLIIPKDSSIRPACGKINVYVRRFAKATFSNDGITGTIEFSQKSPLDPTVTSVNLEGLNGEAGGYHVHLWPVPERKTSAQGSMCAGERVSGHFNPFQEEVGTPSSDTYPAAESSTYDMYEVGDLSAKYGMLNGVQTRKATYTDYNLQLFGVNSIVGRSLVIHRNDATNSRWVCVTIEPQYPVVVAEALFLHPVIGRVMFMQDQDSPDSETSVFASLDYIDERTDTENHLWMVGNKALGSGISGNHLASGCVSAGSVYNPMNLWPGMVDAAYSEMCKNNKRFACKSGDLSGKLGPVSIGNSAASQDEFKKFFATDIVLSLSGRHSIIGKAVVITNAENSGPLACAVIKPVHPIALVARLDYGGIKGEVRFRQDVGFGSKQTSVETDLTGLGEGQSLKIYELPPSEGQSACSNLGAVFDPLEIGDTQPSLTTDDKYKTGDLTRFASINKWSSYNLPLCGLNSIKGRSVAVVDQSSTVSCATIDWDMNDWTRIDTAATFSGEIIGTVSLYQHVFRDGTMSDTTILTDLKYANASQQSMDHNWHTHKTVVSGDSHATNGRCMSTGPHFNPFNAAVTEEAYSMKCSRTNPLRCEVGDQAKKSMTIDVGLGKKLHTDIYEPLIGEYSVQGRSIVVHVANKGAARLACADIKPMTATPVEVTFNTPATFSGLSEANKLQRIREAYAQAIRSYPGEVIVVIKKSNQEETTTLVHFVGTRSEVLRLRFEKFINDEDDRDKLGAFAPTLNFADIKGINIFLVLFALVQSVLCSFILIS